MAKGRKTGGRKKGTPNKRQDLQEFLDAIFERVDPVQLAVKLLKGKVPNERLLIRLLEYRYGRPPLLTGGETTMPKVIDVSGMRSRPSEPYHPAATNLRP
jgi:hypothetical protein